eukprot:TRINITY_DN5742_c2_g1_i1.p2 TRINITY_DN5742_c2_g1~~TRINITY_DN5742_c2_g1_i1.p2  ORF type:complete len:120 (-),score=0.76 TRINITY_DN5742_c2_g1_i1:528-887(-)
MRHRSIHSPHVDPLFFFGEQQPARRVSGMGVENCQQRSCFVCVCVHFFLSCGGGKCWGGDGGRREWRWWYFGMAFVRVCVCVCVCFVCVNVDRPPASPPSLLSAPSSGPLFIPPFGTVC